MKLAQKNADFFQKYHWLIAPLFAILAGYAGIDGYGKYQELQSVPAVNIVVESQIQAIQKDYTPVIEKVMEAHIKEFH